MRVCVRVHIVFTPRRKDVTLLAAWTRSPSPNIRWRAIAWFQDSFRLLTSPRAKFNGDVIYVRTNDGTIASPTGHVQGDVGWHCELCLDAAFWVSLLI